MICECEEELDNLVLDLNDLLSGQVCWRQCHEMLYLHLYKTLAFYILCNAGGEEKLKFMN
jgi:hypothetical protein